MGFKMVQWCI